jgi:short-subunit dehydrogenase
VVVATGVVGFGSTVGTIGEGTGTAESAAANAKLLSQINYLGPASFVSQLLPNLLQREASFVTAITGVVAEKIFPGMAAYSASKWAFRTWLETLRMEGKSKGLAVFEARPGHTETGLATRARFGKAPAMPTGIVPVSVAERIVRGIEAEESVISSEMFLN